MTTYDSSDRDARINEEAKIVRPTRAVDVRTGRHWTLEQRADSRVIVRSAVTATPGTDPLVTSIPDGVSSATTRSPRSPMRSTSSPIRPRGAPRKLYPISASMTTSARPGSSTTLTPIRSMMSYWRDGTGTSARGDCPSVTLTSTPALARWQAARTIGNSAVTVVCLDADWSVSLASEHDDAFEPAEHRLCSKWRTPTQNDIGECRTW